MFGHTSKLRSIVFGTGENVETHEESLFLSDLHLDTRDFGGIITFGRTSGGKQGSLVVDGRVVLVVLPSSAAHQTGIVDSATEESVLRGLGLGNDSVTTASVLEVVFSRDDTLCVKSRFILDSA